jgi:hypothetical protein
MRLVGAELEGDVEASQECKSVSPQKVLLEKVDNTLLRRQLYVYRFVNDEGGKFEDCPTKRGGAGRWNGRLYHMPVFGRWVTFIRYLLILRQGI